MTGRQANPANAQTARFWVVMGCVGLLCLLVFYVAVFGLFPRFLDLSWREEIRLANGRVLLIKVKHTYERRGFRLLPYGDMSFRGNEIEFDAGPKEGYVKFSSRLPMQHLDQVSGSWYVVLFGQGPYGNFPDEMPDHWGRDYTVLEQRLAQLRNGKFEPVPWDAMGQAVLRKSNFIVGSIPVSVLSKYNGRTVSLEDKAKLRVAYPPGPDGGSIERPLRMKTTNASNVLQQ